MRENPHGPMDDWGGLVRKMSWCHGGDVHSFVEMVIFPEFDAACPSKCLSEHVSEATVEESNFFMGKRNEHDDYVGFLRSSTRNRMKWNVVDGL